MEIIYKEQSKKGETFRLVDDLPAWGGYYSIEKESRQGDASWWVKVWGSSRSLDDARRAFGSFVSGEELEAGRFTVDDVKFLADSCRIFTIKHRRGLFYVERVANIPERCALVNEYENGMRPGVSMLWGDLADYLTREMAGGKLSFLTPYNR